MVSRFTVVQRGVCCLADALILLITQAYLLGADVLFEVGEGGRAGNRQHIRCAMQQPGQCELGRGSVEVSGDGYYGTAGSGEVAEGEREEWQERDALLRGVLHYRIVVSRREIVEILYRGDRRGASGLVQLFNPDLGETDMTNLPLLPQLGECADLVGDGVDGVEAVELDEVDLLESEAAQTQFNLLLEIGGMPEHNPVCRCRAQIADLRRDDQVVAVRVQGLSDEFFALAQGVGVGGVDQLYAEFDRSVQERDRVRRVVGCAPDLGTGLGSVAGGVGQAHGAESDPAYREVTAEDE